MEVLLDPLYNIAHQSSSYTCFSEILTGLSKTVQMTISSQLGVVNDPL
jgi:hypothetical protein